LGFTTDLTYPMYFYREQFEPYFVDLDDWTRPGDSDLLEVPNFADMTMESQDPGLERDRDQWPLFRTRGGAYLLERSLAYHRFCQDRGLETYLCYYIHPWEFWPMGASYNFGEATVIPDEFITANCGSRALAEFGILLEGLKASGARFVQAKDLPEMVRARRQAA
jgi:hypothetical protein